ncbi:PspA-associated protein PspAA [Candidatus Methanoliparum sp. LAM-1]|uniref:PspA-associated protein PspAA n=1 Tax=Candidatus Methanoliparum sp. LAM-1 TaxID=2874846 RepID=UPI001E3716BB|nr:hypothetical protein [Candidatus Methanoliparum sp. LAM-1]BDC36264.1 hypothetical protein MTLP_09460 [Candidatus Methanoliparum sp. LAM-1]
MIVRIMTDHQYEVDDSLLEELNEIDNRIVSLVEKDDESFIDDLKKLIKIVKERGKILDDSLLKNSEIIIPPEDIRLDEAKKIFMGEGIFPD